MRFRRKNLLLLLLLLLLRSILLRRGSHDHIAASTSLCGTAETESRCGTVDLVSAAGRRVGEARRIGIQRRGNWSEVTCLLFLLTFAQ